MENLTGEENLIMELPVMANGFESEGNVFGDLISGRSYLSGYEAVSFRRDAKFALEVVLTSTVSYNDSLVLLGSSAVSKVATNLCNKHQLSYFDLSNKRIDYQIEELALLFQNNKQISSALLMLNERNQVSEVVVSLVAEISRTYQVDLVIYTNKDYPYSLANTLNNEVSFLVSSPNRAEENSLVVARRSSLVKTEGGARYFRYDLHSYWQQSLKRRSSLVTPLAV